MFRINLILKKKSDDVLELAPSLLFRISFVVIAVVLLLAVTLTPEDGLPVPGIILIVISVLAVLYEERWSFDRQEKNYHLQIRSYFSKQNT